MHNHREIFIHRSGGTSGKVVCHQPVNLEDHHFAARTQSLELKVEKKNYWSALVHQPAVCIIILFNAGRSFKVVQ